MNDQSANDRDTLAAHITSLTAKLTDADHVLRHERKIEDHLVFSIGQSMHEMQSTILGMRNAYGRI